MVFSGPAGCTDDTLDDADLIEPAQPLCQQGCRHARHAAANVVEARTATEKLAHDQWCPTFTEHLRAAGGRAELAVVDHESRVQD
jgi:hypothetical protein